MRGLRRMTGANFVASVSNRGGSTVYICGRQFSESRRPAPRRDAPAVSPPPSPPPHPQLVPQHTATSNGLPITATASEAPTSPYHLSNFPGASTEPFSDAAAAVLMAPLDPDDVEIKPDGILYLPEIKYRRILNRAIGPGAWSLIPRSDSHIEGRTLSRVYALFCHGRFVSQAQGEFESNYSKSSEGVAEEAAKSNALMRCCKDLGVASEMWDPPFIIDFKKKHCVAVFADNQVTKKKHKLWRRKDRPPFEYPWKEA